MVTQAARPINRLPLQPLTAVAVLRNVSKPELASATLARLVEVDPALSAMVLRMANSPLFGFGGRVSSARQATMLLGTKTVGSLAVGGTASLVFGTVDARTIPGYWAHAVTVACASSTVARFHGVNPEEAFTAGLLHSSGRLMAAEDDMPADDRCGAERSAELLRDWGMPTALVRAVRMHNAKREGVTDPVALAVLLGHALAPAVEDTRPTGPLTPREAFVAVGAGSGRFDEVITTIRRDVEGVAKFLEAEAA
jgi:HD-like signal output (HDOD) protein